MLKLTLRWINSSFRSFFIIVTNVVNLTAIGTPKTKKSFISCSIFSDRDDGNTEMYCILEGPNSRNSIKQQSHLKSNGLPTTGTCYQICDLAQNPDQCKTHASDGPPSPNLETSLYI